jgi:hypothetical protein
MMSFGQKSYQMAIAHDQYVGLVGFQVENLLTRVDEFYVLPQAMKPIVVEGLIDAVEAASKELQSEIGFFFLPQKTPQMILDVFKERDYLARTLEEIKVPAWREAARESQPEATLILAKKLRAERVLKPL